VKSKRKFNKISCQQKQTNHSQNDSKSPKMARLLRVAQDSNIAIPPDGQRDARWQKTAVPNGRFPTKTARNILKINRTD